MSYYEITPQELARAFVFGKKEKIEQLLDVKNLDTYAATQTVYSFLIDKTDDFWKIYSNNPNIIFEDVFFYQVINNLKHAQKHGKIFDGGPHIPHPHITYLA